MSKYDPLWQYFSNTQNALVDLSFDDIKQILGFSIDHSFLNYKKEHGVVDETAKSELQLWYLHDKGISTQEEILGLITESLEV